MDTNPILDELNGLSPGAKAALQQAHTQQLQTTMGTQAPQLGALRQPQQAAAEPPPIPSMQAPSQVPAIPAMQGPKVQAPRGTVEGDQAALTQEINKKPALETVYSKIHNSEFGQNHPVAGRILGALAQIPATAADIGLTAGVPRIGAMVPETTAQHGVKIGALTNAVKGEEENREKEAQTAEINARTTAMPEAAKRQTEQIQAGLAEHGLTMDEQGNITPVPDEQLSPALRASLQGTWKPVPGVAGPNGEPMEYNEKFGTYRPAPGSAGASLVATDKVTGGIKGDLQTRLVAAQNSGNTAEAKKLQQQLKDIDPMGEQRIVIQQQGQANANQRAVDARTEREYQYTRQKWDKELQTYQTQNEKLQEAESFVGRGAMGDAIGSIKALSGLASGSGSGVRITQAELNSIAHARGFSGDFQAYLQKFGDGRNLTPPQEKELKGILTGIENLARAKETVLNRALDDLGNANDIPSIRKIDSQVRNALMGTPR